MTRQASGHWERPVFEQLKNRIIHTVIPEREEATQIDPELQPEGPQNGEVLCLPKLLCMTTWGRMTSFKRAMEIHQNLTVKKRKGDRPYCVYYQNGWGGSAQKSKRSTGFRSQAGQCAAMCDWSQLGGRDPWYMRVKMDEFEIGRFELHDL